MPQAQTNGAVTRSTDPATAHGRADLDDDAGELVPGHVRQPDVRVVTHPAVPVAAAQTGGLDTYDHAVARARRVGHVEHGGHDAERVDAHRPH